VHADAKWHGINESAEFAARCIVMLLGTELRERYFKRSCMLMPIGTQAQEANF